MNNLLFYVRIFSKKEKYVHWNVYMEKLPFFQIRKWNIWRVENLFGYHSVHILKIPPEKGKEKEEEVKNLLMLQFLPSKPEWHAQV